MMYEQVIDDTGSTMVKRINLDGTESWIPLDPANADYQLYLESLKSDK